MLNNTQQQKYFNNDKLKWKKINFRDSAHCPPVMIPICTYASILDLV